MQVTANTGLRVALAFAVCLVASTRVAGAFAADPLPAPTLTAIPDKPAAKDFTLKDINGKRHRLSDYRGKVVLVNFWATWCPPCRREIPAMQRLWDKLKSEDFVMLAVDMAEDEETVFGFTFATGVEITFPVLLDTDGAVTESWPVIGMPTSFIIDRKGRTVYRAVGGREWDDPGLVASIRSLIAEQKP
jgi:peroxiredoxin